MSAKDDIPPEKKEVESYAATGIDNALDLLEVVTAKMDKASVGAKAGEIERHPEVRFWTQCIWPNRAHIGSICATATLQGIWDHERSMGTVTH